MAALIDTLDRAVPPRGAPALVARAPAGHRPHAGADGRQPAGVRPGRRRAAGGATGRELARFGPLFVWMWSVVQWPAAAVLVVTALHASIGLRRISREWVWISPGSLAAAALWLLISLGFKW